MMELTLDMEVPGYVTLGERGKRRTTSGAHRTLEPLDSSDCEINVSVGSDLTDGVTVTLAVYHVENPETKRVFHANLMATFTLPQLHALIKGLQYLAEHMAESVGT